jgi:hypothetical protein
MYMHRSLVASPIGETGVTTTVTFALIGAQESSRPLASPRPAAPRSEGPSSQLSRRPRAPPAPAASGPA